MERDPVAGLLLEFFAQEQGAVSVSKALAFVRAASPERPEDDETLLALIVDLASHENVPLLFDINSPD